VYAYDIQLHAAILHLMGMDQKRLLQCRNSREMRFTDFEGR
jgi:hypothetical protein